MDVLRSSAFWRIYLNALFIFLLLLVSILYISQKALPEISRSHFQEITDAEVVDTAEKIKILADEYLKEGHSIQEKLWNRDSEAVKETVQSQVSISPLFDAGVIVDTEGTITHIYPYEISRVDPDYVRTNLQEILTISEVTIASGITVSGKEPYIGVAIPLNNSQGQIEQIMYLGSFTKENFLLSSLLNSNELGVGGYTAVIDDTGVILAHRDRERIGEKEIDSIIQKLLNGESGYEQTVNHDGTPVYISYQHIPDLAWNVTAQVPVSSTYELMSSFENSIWKMSTITFLLLSMLSYVYARRTLLPMNRLYHTVDQIAKGNYQDKLDVNIKGHPEITRLLVRFNEMVDHLKQSRRKIEYQAYHDALTGLPNRYHIEESLTEAIAKSKENHQPLALMFIDLDRFKVINDTVGHQIGDLLLKETAERLKLCVRKEDLVARQGGDEFLILLEGVGQEETSTIAQAIIDRLSTPFILIDQEFFTSPSIGISFYPEDGETMERIIKNADAAMYLAKERGRNNFQFYTMDPSNILTRRHKLEYGLRRAIENNEFILYYQPQIDLMTNQLCGLEALIRWQHPEFGMIPPNEFIPLAEENGLIHEIGKWVIKQACHQNKKWQEAGLPHVAVAINISPVQFRDPTFVLTVIEVVKESKLASEYLELEITESTVHSFTDTVEKLRTIKEHGIKISIDDFGTGYPSLSAIDNLPIDQIKIDRSFIINMISNSNKAAIVKTIIDLGHNLHFQIVAEGIEYTEQMDVLKEYKCHIGQGYLFSCPLTVEEVERLYIKTDTALQKEKMKRKSKGT